METAIEITQKESTDNKGINGDSNGKFNGNEVSVDCNVEVKAPPQTTEKKPVKKPKEGKRNKEEEKRIKLLLRAFDGLENTEAKLEALAKKYVQLAAEQKSVENRKDDLESRNEKITKERDALQSDYNKATLAKSKLESLCRELQRHSKLVKEECQLRAQEEETKRKELSERFQTTINDISQQMQDNFKRNELLKVENEELATKLKGLVDQYESREEHVDKVFKHKQLELQLAEAKMAQQSLQFNEIKEKSLVEKQELLKDSLDYRKKYEIMVKQEKELRLQVAMYTEKFDEFQSTLTKSNEMFSTFKREMDKMTKTIKKLEKENRTLKTRFENTNRSLLDMLEERTKMEKDGVSLRSRNDKLENLCRAMQKERLILNRQVIDELPKPDEISEAQPVMSTAGATHGTATPPMGSTDATRDGDDMQSAATPSEMTSESSAEDASDSTSEVTDASEATDTISDKTVEAVDPKLEAASAEKGASDSTIEAPGPQQSEPCPKPDLMPSSNSAKESHDADVNSATPSDASSEKHDDNTCSQDAATTTDNQATAATTDSQDTATTTDSQATATTTDSQDTATTTDSQDTATTTEQTE